MAVEESFLPTTKQTENLLSVCIARLVVNKGMTLTSVNVKVQLVGMMVHLLIQGQLSLCCGYFQAQSVSFVGSVLTGLL